MKILLRHKKNNLLKNTIFSIFTLLLSFFLNQSFGQNSFETNTDSIFSFKQELGISVGGFTYTHYAPASYLEKFQFQYSKGIQYRVEKGHHSVRIGYNNSKGIVNHIATQFYEIRDTLNINGNQKANMINIGYEYFLYRSNAICFYTGVDATYSRNKFTGLEKSIKGTVKFEQNNDAFGFGIEPFMGVRFNIKNKINFSIESAYDLEIIKTNSERVYQFPEPLTELNTSTRFSTAPSPLSKVSIGLVF